MMSITDNDTGKKIIHNLANAIDEENKRHISVNLIEAYLIAVAKSDTSR